MVNMKRVLQYLTLFIFIFLMPIFVFAEIKESEIVSKKELIRKIDAGSVIITNVGYTEYFNVLSTGRAGVIIQGTVNNNYVRDVDIEVTLKIYDKNKNVVEQNTSVMHIPAKDKLVYMHYIYEDEISTTLDKIQYYSIGTDIISDVEILDEGQKDKYYLENYNIEVNVSENNTYSVSESFDAVFNSNVISLSKGIPFRHNYVRTDGSKENKRAIISDIVVDDYYKLSTEKGIRYIKIGKQNKSETKKNYVLKYKYNVGKDTLKGKDEFVFYLVNNLTVKTDGISFKVVMPKEFAEKNIKFLDANGQKIENITYEVNGNVITGKFNDVINPGVSYAISIDLEDNYFKGCSSNISMLSIISFIIPILFVIFAIIIFVINKKNNEKVVFNNIYFNEKINSLELGYLLLGDVKDNDIASLLFCLANKGYIDIVKENGSYILVKKKEYLEDDRVEMAFMKELFFANDKIVKKELLNSLTDLRNAIVIKLDNKNKRKKKIFTRKILNYKLLFWIMICIIIVLNTVNILIEYQPSVIIVNCVLSVIGYIILLNGLLSKNKFMEKVISTLVSLILIVSTIILTSYGAYFQDVLYTSTYIIGIVLSMVIACIASTMRDRTRYGNKMLNKINAYKTYLIECDSTVIEKEFKENKNCIYEVLPYTLVLGITDTWVEKFRDMKLTKPKWYVSKDAFNLDEFYIDVMNIYSDVFIALKKNAEESDL